MVGTETSETFQLNGKSFSKESGVVLLTHRVCHLKGGTGLLTLTPTCSHIIFGGGINILILFKFESSESLSIPFLLCL